MESNISSTNQPNVFPFPDLDQHQESAETEQARESRMHDYFVTAISAAVKVLNARLLCILALVGSMLFWGIAMIDPNPLRIGCGIGYSLLVLLPVLWTFSKKA